MINYNQELSDYCGGVCDTLVPFYDVPISCGLPRESDVLSAEQKKNKITNLLSYLRIHNVIMVNEKKKWVLVK